MTVSEMEARIAELRKQAGALLDDAEHLREEIMDLEWKAGKFDREADELEKRLDQVRNDPDAEAALQRLYELERAYRNPAQLKLDLAAAS